MKRGAIGQIIQWATRQEQANNTRAKRIEYFTNAEIFAEAERRQHARFSYA